LESPRSRLVEKYPLAFITANNKYFMHTMFANEPSVLKAYKAEPHVSINPKDAAERDIVDGDIVVVSNKRGSCKLKAVVTASVPCGVVQLPHGWWPKQFMEGHLANLLLSLASPETRDEAREIYWSVAVRRPSPSALFGEAYFAYSPDTLFDCLCEVKKVEGERK
jgi:anaerobic selenocysteine-containing dehydrogenase